MAGHSKWANIKFRKGAQDKKRSNLFTKLIREITVAARAGGMDQNNNSRLRNAVDNHSYKDYLRVSTDNDRHSHVRLHLQRPK